MLNSLPLDRVWEIHIAGGRLDDAHPERYVDSHNDPVMQEVIDLLEPTLDQASNAQAITFEVTGRKLDSDVIEADFCRIEQAARRCSFVPTIPHS